MEIDKTVPLFEGKGGAGKRKARNFLRGFVGVDGVEPPTLCL